MPNPPAALLHERKRRNLIKLMNGWTVRLTGGLIALAAMALLVVSAALEPDPAGLGTHQQLGLSACAWLGSHGSVCPTCGMTTAFSLAADGRLIDAWLVQPAAALGALGAAMAVWVGGYVAWAGPPAGRFLAPLWRPGRITAIVLTVVGASWVWKLTIG